MKDDAYDVVVVGGGAAGLSAALVLGRARRRVAVVDAGAPRNAPAAHMHGFLSRDGMPPADLLAEGRDEVAGYGVELVNDQVLGIEPRFVVRVAGGRTVTARRILMATGVSDELPDVPGVRQRWGKDLLHCPYCHGWEVRDQPLGVLGALPGSAQHALLVRQWSGDVVFFVHTYDLMPAEQRQLEARRIQVVSGKVARLVIEDDQLTGVELTDGRVVARTAVFVRPGNLPHDDGLLAGLGLRAQPGRLPARGWHRADQRARRLGSRERGRPPCPGDHLGRRRVRSGHRHQCRPGPRGRRTGHRRPGGTPFPAVMEARTGGPDSGRPTAIAAASLTPPR